jgi:A/G-specific adenine glycosylase
VKFSSHILRWYHKEHRNLPWRASKEPYKVWLSEIILQQTRVSQGLDYYTKFTSTFPTIKDLALADEQQVLKLWQGLGYYSRARNLHATAKYIHFDLKDLFPTNYKDLLKLKGIGPYTASAISSICFNEKRAAVDGNVYRVLARVFNINTAINSTLGIKEFQLLADSLISEKEPGDYNQGLMELGATVCMPKKVDCCNCPLNSLCLAKHKNTINLLPIKEKKIGIKERHLNYFFIEYKSHFLMNKREGKGIWQNLYDFPLEELNTAKEDCITNYKPIKELLGNKTFTVEKRRVYKHKLSHQNLNITIHHISTKHEPQSNNYSKVNRAEALELPVPKPIEKFFTELFDEHPLDKEL